MLAEAVASSQRSSAPFALLYLDVDGFKQVNDRHGHLSGDAALIAISERLRGAIRHIDHAFRLGGDEFAILLAPFHNRAHVEGVVERIRAAMEEPFLTPDGRQASASLSVGVAIFPDDGAGLEELLGLADRAMYRAKQARREGNSEGMRQDA